MQVFIKTFLEDLGGVTLPPEVIQSSFRLFDTDQDGKIDFSEFVAGLSLCCNGKKDEKLRFVFDMYDLDKDGFLNKAETELLLRSAQALAGDPEDAQEMRSQLLTAAQQYQHLLPFDAFRDFAESNMEVHAFLHRFDVLPSVDQERRLIRQLMDAASNAQLRVGDTWYLLHYKWWTGWKEYAAYDAYVDQDRAVIAAEAAAATADGNHHPLHPRHMPLRLLPVRV